MYCAVVIRHQEPVKSRFGHVFSKLIGVYGSYHRAEEAMRADMEARHTDNEDDYEIVETVVEG